VTAKPLATLRPPVARAWFSWWARHRLPALAARRLYWTDLDGAIWAAYTHRSDRVVLGQSPGGLAGACGPPPRGTAGAPPPGRAASWAPASASSSAWAGSGAGLGSPRASASSARRRCSCRRSFWKVRTIWRHTSGVSFPTEHRPRAVLRVHWPLARGLVNGLLQQRVCHARCVRRNRPHAFLAGPQVGRVARERTSMSLGIRHLRPSASSFARTSAARRSSATGWP
jgi:hypothetical protein